MELGGITEQMRGEVLRIASRHGAVAVRVFGSVAQGRATEDSDLDLLVKMKPGSSLLDIVAIKQDLESNCAAGGAESTCSCVDAVVRVIIIHVVNGLDRA